MAVSGKVASENIQNEVHTTEAKKFRCLMSPSPYYGTGPMTWAGACKTWPGPGPRDPWALWARTRARPKKGRMKVRGQAHVAGTCPCHWPGPIIWAWTHQATEFFCLRSMSLMLYVYQSYFSGHCHMYIHKFGSIFGFRIFGKILLKSLWEAVLWENVGAKM